MNDLDLPAELWCPTKTRLPQESAEPVKVTLEVDPGKPRKAKQATHQNAVHQFAEYLRGKPGKRQLTALREVLEILEAE